MAAALLPSADAFAANEFIYGNINGTEDWTANPNTWSSNWSLSHVGGNKYEKVVTITKTSWFRIRLNDLYYSRQSDTGNETIDGSDKTYKTWKKTKAGDGGAFEVATGRYKITVNNDGVDNVTFTMVKMPEKLYVYCAPTKDNWTYSTPYLELNANADGTFTGTVNKTNEGDSYYFFTYEKINGTEWGSFNNKRYTPGSDTDWTNECDVKQSESGTYMLKNKGTYTFWVNPSTGRTKASVPQAYYLTGDLNGWIRNAVKTGDKNPIASEAVMNQYKFEPCTESGKEGWYVLHLDRMHGQFQITTGNFKDDAKRYGHMADYQGWSGTSVKPPHEWYYTQPVPEEMPTSANMQMKTNTEEVNYNFFLQHNYYNNCDIYFHPDQNKVYLTGTPEDLYIYYYSENEADETHDAVINIKNAAENQNHNNYFFDENLLNANFEKVTLNDKEKKDPALEGIEKCYRYQIIPGLEEQFLADNIYRYYTFKMSGAQQVSENQTYKIDGKNFYFINKKAILAFSLKVGDEEVHYVNNDKIKEVAYRYIGFDVLGNPKYIKPDGSLTDKMDEAYKITLSGSHSLNDHPNKIEGRNLYHVQPKASGQANVAPRAETGWRDATEGVEVAHKNRFVEVAVTYAAQKTANPYDNFEQTEFYSDFDRKYNENAVTDALAPRDSNGNFLQNFEGFKKPATTPTSNYKLNGTHLVLAADSNVPVGVDKIGVDSEENVAPVYYNLQGMRVEKPVKGIYIRVTGKKSEKVIF